MDHNSFNIKCNLGEENLEIIYKFIFKIYYHYYYYAFSFSIFIFISIKHTRKFISHYLFFMKMLNMTLQNTRLF